MAYDSIPCVGGPHHGKNLPNSGRTAEVVQGGARVHYDRDSMILCGAEFQFWRFAHLPSKIAYEMIQNEARGVVRELVQETYAMANDLAKA